MAKIDTSPFLVEKDLTALNSWMEARDLKPIDKEGIPALGLIASYRGSPVCAAFLRRCEGDVVMLDGLITDPKAESSIRHEALDLIVSRLLAIAKIRGMTQVFAFTKDDSVLKRSVKHGFKKTNFQVISQEL